MNNLLNDLNKFETIPTAALNKVDNSDALLFEHTQGDTNNAAANSSQPQQTAFTDQSTQQPHISTMQPIAQGQRLNVGALFDAELGVNLMDIILPAILVIVIAKATKKVFDKRKLQMTAKEKETVKPVLQNYLNSINFSIESPLNALVFTVSIIYGTKALEIGGDAIDKLTTAGAGVNEQQSASGSTRKPGETRGRKKKIV